MTEQEDTSFADRYAGSKVAPPPEAPAMPEAPVETDAVAPEKAADPNSPFAQYAGYQVVDRQDVQRFHTSEETVSNLNSGSFGKTTEKHTAMDWIGDVARATILGPLGDGVGALYLSSTMDNVSYEDALKAVRRNRAEKGVSGTATFIGAVLGGGAVYKAGKYALGQAAAKSGMIDGAMKQAANGPWFKRVAGSAAAGGGLGLVEEGVRTTLEESIDASGGMAFDADRITDNMMVGAMFGAAAAPVFDAASAGAGWMVDYFKRQNPESPQAAQAAMRSILKEFKTDSETLDEAGDRFRRELQSKRERLGKMPTAAQILTDEQVAAVADVSRAFNGLDTRARALSEQEIKKSLDAYDDVVSGAWQKGDVPSSELIELRLRDNFTGVMKDHGNTMVKVDPEKLGELKAAKNLIQRMAPDNPGAKQLLKVIEADEGMVKLTSDMDKLQRTLDAEPAKFGNEADRLEMGNILDDAMRDEAGKVDLARYNELKVNIKLRTAIEEMRKGDIRRQMNAEEMASMKTLMAEAKAELDAFRANGMNIKLTYANNIRQQASTDFNKARRGMGDSIQAQNEYRRVRDIVAPIGQEVPQYKQALRVFKLESIRADAQETGQRIAKGDIAMGDIEARLKGGNLPKRARVNPLEDADGMASLRQGADEGTRRQLQQEARGGPKKALTSAERVATNDQVEKGMKESLGNYQATQIKRVATQVMEDYDKYKALAKPTSVSELGQERRFVGEILNGAVFGSMGGAGRAALLNRILTKFQIPKGQARMMIELLGNPDEKKMEVALQLMQKRGIKIGPLFASINAALTEPTANEYE